MKAQDRVWLNGADLKLESKVDQKPALMLLEYFLHAGRKFLFPEQNAQFVFRSPGIATDSIGHALFFNNLCNFRVAETKLVLAGRMSVNTTEVALALPLLSAYWLLISGKFLTN